MIRSMYAAISGLRTHQTMMDVVGNNIANVNTTGFKSSTTVFNDVLYQTVLSGNGPGAMGGTNPAQVGLGVGLATINNNFAQGALQRTGRNTDLAMQGDGFFVVEQNGEQLYTRSGSFSIDASGGIVSTEGARVQGWMYDTATGVLNTNGPLTDLTVPVGSLINPTQTSSVTMTGNLPAGLATGDDVITTINVFDPQGNAHSVAFQYVKNAAADTWDVAAYVDGSAVPVAGFNPQVIFDAAGQMTTPATFDLTLPAGAVPNTGAITVGLGQPGDPQRVTQYGTTSSLLARDQNGAAPGTLQSFIIGRDGLISGSYSNGQKQPIGQLATATFTNPQGLEKMGSSTFRTSQNSGAVALGTAGSGGNGVMVQGTLEQSNVDLAQEFTQLIMAQRGFQANSRVITTSDEMLQDVVNLKR